MLKWISYLIILKVLRDHEVVPLIQTWFKRISCLVRVHYGLYVKILVIECNQRMPVSNQQKFVLVATIIEGLYLDPKCYPVGWTPDWESHQLLFLFFFEMAWWGNQFRESFMLIIIIIYPTKFIDKSVEPNVVEEGGAHHTVPIFTVEFTFLLLKTEVVTSRSLLTVQRTRSLINIQNLYV